MKTQIQKLTVHIFRYNILILYYSFQNCVQVLFDLNCFVYFIIMNKYIYWL